MKEKPVEGISKFENLHTPNRGRVTDLMELDEERSHRASSDIQEEE